MADSPPPATDNPLLRGLFGVVQSGAQQRLSTADIWSSLRTAAGTWQFQAQGVAQPYDPAALEAAGRDILRAQGVGIQGVNQFRGLAGQWLGSKQALHAQGDDEQITAGSVFTPPWSATADASVPSRYRIRTQWQYEDADGELATRWKADELSGPLTTISDALENAEPTDDTTSGAMILSGNEPPVMLDYEIEEI